MSPVSATGSAVSLGDLKVGVEDWIYPRAHQVRDVVQVHRFDDAIQIRLMVPRDRVVLHQSHLARQIPVSDDLDASFLLFARIAPYGQALAHVWVHVGWTSCTRVGRVHGDGKIEFSPHVPEGGFPEFAGAC